MKGAIGTIADLVGGDSKRDDLGPLIILRFGVLLALVVALFSAIFHVLMGAEGQRHDWFTGVYWTLTTMSTLGYGDVVFESGLGRAFGMLVLATGVILILVVLPFGFIRLLLAWMESQFRTRVDTKVPGDLEGHVIVSMHDDVADELVGRLAQAGVESVVIEADPVRAASMHADKVPVVRGDRGARATYENCAFGRAKLLVANASDVINTNIVLTAREVSESVPIVATAANPEAEAVLRLAGADKVVLATRRLGRQLAIRVPVGSARALTVGRYKEIAIAEFPIRDTRLGGLTLRESGVRTHTGLTVFAIAKRGHLEPGLPDTVLREDCIGLAVGSAEQVDALNRYIGEDAPGEGRVVVVGGGRVGREVARSLDARGATVGIVERNPSLRETLMGIADDVTIGDMTDNRVIGRVEIRTAASLVLTTNDDATNIFLAVYCRKLNPDAIIVSRVTSPANVEAIHRAGADFAVSDSEIAIQSILAAVRGSQPMILGEGLDLFTAVVPRSLAGKPLRGSGILARTGLAVFAVDGEGAVEAHPRPDRILRRRERLLFVGTVAQRDEFERVFG